MHHSVLRYVDEVARQGSIRKAAKILHVASSAVNRQILKLEEELGIRLFDRLPEGVIATPAGRTIVEHCRRTLYEFRNVKAAIEDIRDLRTGHIRVSTLDSVTFSFLPEVVGAFNVKYPGISFTVAVAPPEETLENIASGQVDVGISFIQSDHPEVRVLAQKSTPFGIVVKPDHPLADRPVVKLLDCLPYPLVRTIDARGRESIVDQATDPDLHSLMTVFFTNSLVMAKQAIQSDIGMGIYTKVGFITDVRDGLFRFVPLEEKPLSEFRIGILASAQRNLDTASGLFVAALQQAFRQVDFS